MTAYALQSTSITSTATLDGGVKLQTMQQRTL